MVILLAPVAPVALAALGAVAVALELVVQLLAVQAAPVALAGQWL